MSEGKSKCVVISNASNRLFTRGGISTDGEVSLGDKQVPVLLRHPDWGAN